MSKAEPSIEDIWARVTGRKGQDRQTNVVFPDIETTFYNFVKSISSHMIEIREPTVEERLQTLEKEVQKLKHEDIKNVTMEKINKVNIVYERFREQLEQNDFGKIVAIDLDSEKIVGIGNSVMEAYKDALRNSERHSFSYKRVGSPYLYRLR
jgi:hypothetical protein